MTVAEMLGIKYPIIGGAMARISTHKIVAAVSEAGGLGILGAGGWTGNQLREEIAKTRELTNKPFGVNLMLQMPNIDEIVDIVIEQGIKVVTTGAGSPERYIPRLKEVNTTIIPVIATVRHAKKMAGLGVDAIVAEGQEAGGHIGSSSTMALLPQVVDAVDIPVLGAGGLGDGRSLVAMYALGAQGVQAGTIFLTAEECAIPDNYKQKVIEANDTATIVTGRKAKDPVRSLRNPMLERYAKLEAENAPIEELQKLTVGSLSRAIYDGDMETGSAMAGEIAGLITSIRPAKEIIESIFKEAEEIISNLKIIY